MHSIPKPQARSKNNESKLEGQPIPRDKSVSKPVQPSPSWTQTSPKLAGAWDEHYEQGLELDAELKSEGYIGSISDIPPTEEEVEFFSLNEWERFPKPTAPSALISDIQALEEGFGTQEDGYMFVSSQPDMGQAEFNTLVEEYGVESAGELYFLGLLD